MVYLRSPSKSEAELGAEPAMNSITDTYSEPKTLNDPKTPLNQAELKRS